MNDKIQFTGDNHAAVFAWAGEDEPVFKMPSGKIGVANSGPWGGWPCADTGQWLVRDADGTIRIE